MMSNFREISLSRGQKAIVDSEDYDRLMQWKWYCSNTGYATRDVVISAKNPRKVLKIPMHREVMSQDSGVWFDHINGDRLDNRKTNLRKCSPSQNAMNCSIHKNKKSSIYKGVFKKGKYEKYKAIIGYRNKLIYLGTFDTEQEAAEIYNEAAIKYFGEFARLNSV